MCRMLDERRKKDKEWIFGNAAGAAQRVCGSVRGGVCGKWECEEHNRKPQTTRALTCRWYSKRIAGGSRQEENAEEHSESETQADWFWDDWEATTKETMRLLREIAED